MAETNLYDQLYSAVRSLAELAEASVYTDARDAAQASASSAARDASRSESARDAAMIDGRYLSVADGLAAGESPFTVVADNTYTTYTIVSGEAVRIAQGLSSNALASFRAHQPIGILREPALSENSLLKLQYLFTQPTKGEGTVDTLTLYVGPGESGKCKAYVTRYEKSGTPGVVSEGDVFTRLEAPIYTLTPDSVNVIDLDMAVEENQYLGVLPATFNTVYVSGSEPDNLTSHYISGGSGSNQTVDMPAKPDLYTMEARFSVSYLAATGAAFQDVSDKLASARKTISSLSARLKNILPKSEVIGRLDSNDNLTTLDGASLPWIGYYTNSDYTVLKKFSAHTQGYTTDGTNHFVTFSGGAGYIKKFDANWNLLLERSFSELPDAVNHPSGCGYDADAHSIYTGAFKIVNNVNVPDVPTYIVEFDADDLSIKKALPGGSDIASNLAVYNKTIYGANYDNTHRQRDVIHVYKRNLRKVESIPLVIASDHIQGVYVDESGLYASVNSSPILISKWSPDGGAPVWERRFVPSEELEDLDFSNGDVVSVSQAIWKLTENAARPDPVDDGVCLASKGFFKTPWRFGRHGTVIFWAQANTATNSGGDSNMLMARSDAGYGHWTVYVDPAGTMRCRVNVHQSKVSIDLGALDEFHRITFRWSANDDGTVDNWLRVDGVNSEIKRGQFDDPGQISLGYARKGSWTIGWASHFDQCLDDEFVDEYMPDY